MRKPGMILSVKWSPKRCGRTGGQSGKEGLEGACAGVFMTFTVISARRRISRWLPGVLKWE